MSKAEFDELLTAARGGCRRSIGVLLDGHRNYLLAIANAELTELLASKLGGSDLVQEALLEATQSIHQFTGGSEAELAGWLRRILLCNVADSHRQYLGTAARDVRRERPGSEWGGLDQFRQGTPTPSSEIVRLEDRQRFDAALARLPDEDRAVIEMRNRDQLRFAEIGRRTGRTEAAARMFWKRAIDKLRQVMQGDVKSAD